MRLALGGASPWWWLVAAIAVAATRSVNHLAGNIHRIPSAVAALDAANQPLMPAATRRSMTILLTGSESVPAHIGGSGVLGSSTFPEGQSGLIALVHIDADRRAGAIVSIPPDALVQDARAWRHPAVECAAARRPVAADPDRRAADQCAHRPLHGGRLQRAGQHARPARRRRCGRAAWTSSNGVVFHPGINHLTTATALDYVRQTSLSEEGRVLRQQALLRAILDKLAAEHLLTDPTAGFGILNAFTKALSVDSNFTNSALESLALHLHLLGGSAGTFVSAPVARTFTFDGQSAVVLNFRISRQDVAARSGTTRSRPSPGGIRSPSPRTRRDDTTAAETCSDDPGPAGQPGRGSKPNWPSGDPRLPADGAGTGQPGTAGQPETAGAAVTAGPAATAGRGQEPGPRRRRSWKRRAVRIGLAAGSPCSCWWPAWR